MLQGRTAGRFCIEPLGSSVGVMRRNTNRLVLLGLSLMLTTIARAADEPLDRARAAVKDLAFELRETLTEALAQGDPVTAVGACQVLAPQLAQVVAEDAKLEIRRTALRVRNPDNAPDAFETRVLDDFAKRVAEGSDPTQLEHHEIVTEDESRELRYMKAIPMAEEPCAMCHGKSIAPNLAAEIAKLYPEDTATGFAPGELRGAFSVRVKLTEN